MQICERDPFTHRHRQICERDPFTHRHRQTGERVLIYQVTRANLNAKLAYDKYRAVGILC